MLHQDFEPVFIRNPSKQKTTRTVADKKGDTSTIDRIHKLENETENFQIQKIPPLLAREIINVRVKLKLTQKDVANKLCIQQSEYSNLENGTASYTPTIKQLINKLERICGIKFENKTIAK